LGYGAFKSVLLRFQEARVPGTGISIKRLLKLAALSCSFVFLPLYAQEVSETQAQKQLPLQMDSGAEFAEPGQTLSAHDIRINLMSGGGQSYLFPRPRSEFSAFDKFIWTSYPGAIQRMESAFYCNDTPFIDQVRLPLATFWRGRVKLVGFESDVTTANFVMGLPGQGALHNLSAFGGNGFLAVHTPPSDQLAGINMTFTWHPGTVQSGDSSALRGIEYLVHAGRGHFPFGSGRSDSSSAAVH
jgi:hypothetical protein